MFNLFQPILLFSYEHNMIGVTFVHFVKEIDFLSSPYHRFVLVEYAVLKAV